MLFAVCAAHSSAVDGITGMSVTLTNINTCCACPGSECPGGLGAGTSTISSRGWKWGVCRMFVRQAHGSTTYELMREDCIQAAGNGHPLARDLQLSSCVSSRAQCLDNRCSLFCQSCRHTLSGRPGVICISPSVFVFPVGLSKLIFVSVFLHTIYSKSLRHTCTQRQHTR